MPKAKPITLHPHEVRAALRGELGVVLRPVKPQPFFENGILKAWLEGVLRSGPTGHLLAIEIPRRAPHPPGAERWVRETFGIEPERYIQPEVGSFGGRFEEEVFYKVDDFNLPGMQWRPSTHMPRRFSRLTLTIEAVRVVRLEDVLYSVWGWLYYGEMDQTAIAETWDKLHKRHPVESNPWCWLYEVGVKGGR
ncbi:hypothetical protein [Oceanidesulfovibrio marinus]|uniref:Uncharacterized protein n=1 Tax=Oceanidesulfovibrio marinus TaxID=370038 RepID=A0A6P1ZC05_9BACT|nr:hypothetical protein [Oceanidesulfovibrio marinus]TVM31218.1 hypothetical protein DQK91_19100 [Oceanidesulfovibrio marinus]